MTTGDPDPPKKRPDVALRMKEKKNKVNTVVKAALTHRIAPSWNSEARIILRDELDKWVMSTAQIYHRIGLIFNRLLIFCLDDSRQLPKICHALFTGIAMSGMKLTSKKSKDGFSDLVDTFVENEFHDYPVIRRQRGDCQAIAIVAARYKTMFENHCYIPFLDRQKAFVYLWCQINGVDADQRYPVLASINSWKCKNMPKFVGHVHAFITEQRKMIDNPKGLDIKAVKNLGIEKIIHYYHHILSCYTRWGVGRKFSLAPVSSIRAHFLTIDNTVLKEMLKNVISRCDELMSSGIPENVVAAVSSSGIGEMAKVWKDVFDYSGLRRRRTFDCQVDTDGVSICFHFRYTVKRQKKALKRKSQRKSQRVISIDPGRSNIIYAHDAEADEYYRLTRKQWYQETGMVERFQKKTRRLFRLAPVYERMSQAPLKSIKQRDWYRYQQIVTKHYDTLWSLHGCKKERNADLRVHTLKQKCLDRFFNKFVIKGEQKPTIAYGAASMTPGGKGELSVPVKFVYKKCCERFKTIKVLEDYSTVMHAKCKCRTQPVKGPGVKYGSLETIRGLRWCSTCRELVSRDRNACLNIAACYHAGSKRPKYLCRASRLDDPMLPAFRIHKRRRVGSREATGVPLYEAACSYNVGLNEICTGKGSSG